MKKTYWLITILLCCLSACSQYVPIDPNTKTNLYQLDHWKIKARVAVKNNQESFSATLDWKKAQKKFNFHLYGLFGATYAHLIQNSHDAILRLPDDRTYYHSNAEQLLHQTLGWNFPIDALSYWVKGLPSNKQGESIVRMNNGNLEEAYFNNWQVSFSRYQNYSGYLMPKVIKATHPQMSIKLVIQSWTFLPDNQ